MSVGRRLGIALVAMFFATLIGFGAAIWFEFPSEIALALQLATFVLAALAAICVARTVAVAQEAMSHRERPSMTGRGVGVLTFVGLASLVVACKIFVHPRSWPMTVEQAMMLLDVQLSEESQRQLVYRHYDDLIDLHDGLGASIRTQFGMLSGNEKLLRDCDPEYVNADTCSSVIVSRFWKKARADLPATERSLLEALEVKMERVKLKPEEIKGRPLREVVAQLNEAIREQLPEDARFTIGYAPAYAEQIVSVSWHGREPISLREALGRLAASAHLQVKKTPPDLILERPDYIG